MNSLKAGLAAVSPSVMRRHNLSLVLRAVRDIGRISRLELSGRLGLSGAAITRIVSDLIELGYLDEHTQVSTTPGRPRVDLVIRRGVRSVVAVDFRVDRIVAELVDFTGEVLYREHLPQARSLDPNVVATRLGDVIRRVGAQGSWPVVGIGISVPSRIDAGRETALRSLYLDWEGVPLQSLLEHELGPEWPSVVMDDVAQCAALANAREFRRGDNVRLAHIQIGMGAGLGLAGQAYEAIAMYARGTELGRIAHVPVSIDGPLCACGARGCLDAVAGFPALVHSAQACNIEVSDGPDAMNTFCAELLLHHEQGDPAATSAIIGAAGWLARAAAGVMSSCGPNKLTLGGYPLHLGKVFMGAFLDVLAPHMPNAVDVVTTTNLGDEASIAGAAELAIRMIIDDPLAPSVPSPGAASSTLTGPEAIGEGES